MTDVEEPTVTEATVIPPTAAQQAEMIQRGYQFEVERVSALRRGAYETESDPVAFKVIRGEATKEEYCALVEAIKARYPYPPEP